MGLLLICQGGQSWHNDAQNASRKRGGKKEDRIKPFATLVQQRAHALGDGYTLFTTGASSRKGKREKRRGGSKNNLRKKACLPVAWVAEGGGKGEKEGEVELIHQSDHLKSGILCRRRCSTREGGSERKRERRRGGVVSS